MRRRIVFALVRWVSQAIEESYDRFNAGDHASEHTFRQIANGREWVAFPIARRIDRVAFGDALAGEGWWG